MTIEQLNAAAKLFREAGDYEAANAAELQATIQREEAAQFRAQVDADAFDDWGYVD